MALNSEITAALVNGVKVAIIDGSFSAAMGGQDITSLMGSGRRLGGTAANVPGSCSFEVAYAKGFPIRDTLDIRGGQIEVRWDGGSIWLMTGADLTTPVEGSAPEGRLSVSYEGNAWLEKTP